MLVAGEVGSLEPFRVWRRGESQLRRKIHALQPLDSLMLAETVFISTVGGEVQDHNEGRDTRRHYLASAFKRVLTGLVRH